VSAATAASPVWPPLPAGRYPNGARHAHERGLTHRVLLEALILTILSVAIFGMIFQMQSEDFSLAASAEVSSFGIDAGSEPVQSSSSPYATDMRVTGGVAEIKSDATYSISARVESATEYDDAMAAAIPYDLLLAWGDMADPDVYSKLDWSQADRQGMVSGTLGGSGGPDVSTDYVITHVSNNHLIPDNNSIREALASIKAGDLVRIDGRLVDVRFKSGDGRILSVTSSKTRTDQGDGACEILLVERININEKSYR